MGETEKIENGEAGNPFTRRGEGDARHRWCRCHKCDKVEVCTPARDFYTIPDDEKDWLYCEGCFRRYLKKQGIDHMAYEYKQGGIISMSTGTSSSGSPPRVQKEPPPQKPEEP